MIWTGQLRENLKRENENLLISAPNNGIKNYICAKIDKMQPKSKKAKR